MILMTYDFWATNLPKPMVSMSSSSFAHLWCWRTFCWACQAERCLGGFSFLLLISGQGRSIKTKHRRALLRSSEFLSPVVFLGRTSTECLIWLCTFLHGIFSCFTSAHLQPIWSHHRHAHLLVKFAPDCSCWRWAACLGCSPQIQRVLWPKCRLQLFFNSMARHFVSMNGVQHQNGAVAMMQTKQITNACQTSLQVWHVYVQKQSSSGSCAKFDQELPVSLPSTEQMPLRLVTSGIPYSRP